MALGPEPLGELAGIAMGDEDFLGAGFGDGDEGVLRFYDTRRFARMSVLDETEWNELDERLGIEPLYTPTEG